MAVAHRHRLAGGGHLHGAAEAACRTYLFWSAMQQLPDPDEVDTKI